MLILTRKPGESIFIGDNVKVTIVEIKGNQIRVGIDAPSELRIYREEIYLQILEENKQAAMSGMESAPALDNLAAAWHDRRAPEGRPADNRPKATPKPGATALGKLSSKPTVATPNPTLKNKKDSHE